MVLAIIRDVETWTGNEGGVKLNCKKCGLKIENIFIYKTGFCRMCLIDLGYGS